MFAAHCSRLRRELAHLGMATAASPPMGTGRIDDACVVPARLLEDRELAVHDPGPPEELGTPLAFLDGVQHTELLAYAGASPVLAALVAAGVRLRTGRALVTVEAQHGRHVIGRPEALAAAAPALEGFDSWPIDDPAPAHPVRDLELARRIVDRLRGNLELEAYDRFRSRFEDWIVVDGALSVSPRLARDPRAVGISKSHSALPFSGDALVRYLHLPHGRRTSLFEPGGEHAPVAAFALRLWPFEGRDLLHGLVRVELAPESATPAHADAVARWLLCERAPVADDGRWDRLVYGIHTVEQHLRAAYP